MIGLTAIRDRAIELGFEDTLRDWFGLPSHEFSRGSGINEQWIITWGGDELHDGWVQVHRWCSEHGRVCEVYRSFYADMDINKVFGTAAREKQKAVEDVDDGR